MNSAETKPTKPELWQSLAGLLRLGLYRFWQQALPNDDNLLTLLLQDSEQLLGATAALDWQQHAARMQEAWPPRDGVLARFIQDYQLTLPESLLLTLLGEMERSHLISLIIGQLQAPATGNRPSVHLCTALLDALFGENTLQPLRLPDSSLLQAGLIELTGDAPLPLRTLQLKPGYWSVLLGQARGWPECRPLDERCTRLLPNLIRDQLGSMAELLAQGYAKGIVLRGHPNSGRRLVAQELAHLLRRQAIAIPTELWQQETALAIACRYADWLPVLQPELGPGEVWRPHGSRTQVPLVILLGSDGAVQGKDLLELLLPLPDETQRNRLWAKELGSKKLARACAANALLSGPSIVSLAASARLLAQRRKERLTQGHVTQARRQLGSERLRLLAQPVEREIDKNAIVLPPLVENELERLIDRTRQRESLWQGLGDTLRQTHTAGVRALFIGESGTGKTLAASYIATRLGAPLYRVDLSAVMNKYIGESEKNLSALLDMAAASDVVLLFDEADSLFGKRSEGKETGERFANMLTHFLLTRIENHPGIVLLTSNTREGIDTAFTRRLDLIIEFPLPGFSERLKLWRSHLGRRGPGDETYRLLASYCDFTGGQLRNVVLSAAVSAEQGPITSRHLLTGLLAEYRKLGRDLPGKLSQLYTATET